MPSVITTPDGTILGYASRSSRLYAQVIDGFVAMAPMLAAVVLSSFSDAFVGVTMFAAMCWAFFYYFLADGLHSGQSVGKRVAAIRVVNAETGAPCTFRQSFVRNILGVLGPLDWLFIFGERRQRLGDKAAGTVVIVAD